MAKNKKIKKKIPVNKKTVKKKLLKTKVLPKPKKQPKPKKKNAISRNLRVRKIIKKLRPVKKIKKRVITVTEKKARNQWNYTKSKNKKLLKSEINKFQKKDENSFTKFEGRKRKVKTVLNILRLRAVKNNTKIGKSISLLEKKFKRKIRPKKKRPASQLGFLKSPSFYAWQTKEAKLWISGARTGKKDFYLPTYYMDIDRISMLMTSGDSFQMRYNRTDQNPDTKFECYILK